MINYLLNIVTKGNFNNNDKNMRLRVGYLASIVGLLINVMLAVVKLAIGILISSVSVTADGINNLSDAASSIITIVGFRLSSLPSDKEHPYGHGRLEYISALIVAAMVILVGFQFIITSIDRIKNPLPVKFELALVIVLTISIGFKIWLSSFNKVFGEKINSSGLKASGIDALGDVLTTSVVVISIVIGQFTTFPIDGMIGILVSLLIIHNGINLVKETLSPLIGEAPDEELIKYINNDILSYDHVIGTHDLAIHTYGAGKSMAIIDVEFPGDIDAIIIHNIIDKIERDMGEKYNLNLVIHMDPLDLETDERLGLRKEIKKIIKENPIIKSMHDFQVLEDSAKKVVEFHVVVDGNKILKNNTSEKIKYDIEKSIESKCKNIQGIIIVDIEY